MSNESLSALLRSPFEVDLSTDTYNERMVVALEAVVYQVVDAFIEMHMAEIEARVIELMREGARK